MIQTALFDTYTDEYEAWFEENKFVYLSEIAALRQQLPVGDSHGIEVGMGTGRYALPLGIKEGVEPAENMRRLARERGLDVMNAKAERLPYKDMRFDFVLMAFCISYFDDIHAAFREAYRVLKRGGALIIGFVDKESPIGKLYRSRKTKSAFYSHAVFYTVPELTQLLKECGFKETPSISQTLFQNMARIRDVEPVKAGYGEGSFVVMKVVK